MLPILNPFSEHLTTNHSGLGMSRGVEVNPPHPVVPESRGPGQLQVAYPEWESFHAFPT